MMTHPMLIQLSGTPGAGKSTIARALANRCGMAVVDLDIIKSALLDNGVDFAAAGPATYAATTALANDLLAQGHTVIIDSPLMYPELLETGQTLAKTHQAQYFVIECVCPDLDVLDARLKNRIPTASQRRSVQEGPAGAPAGPDGTSLFTHWQTNAVRPTTGYLLLNTSGDLSDTVAEVLEFLEGTEQP